MTEIRRLAFDTVAAPYLDAKNYSCRRVQLPLSTEAYGSTTTTRDGHHVKGWGRKMVCYPNQIVRWVIKWDALSTSFDSAVVRWLLNCDGAD